MRGPEDNPPKALLSAWCNHTRVRGGQLTTSKKSIVNSLRILLPDEMGEDRQGLMSNWINIARNKRLWNHKIEKLKRPGVDIPSPTPETNNTSNNPPPSPPPRQQRRQHGRNRATGPLREAFSVLGSEPNATEREIRVKFRQLSRMYHPDKHQQSQTGMTNEEATEFFQRANNAQENLLTYLRSNPDPL